MLKISRIGADNALLNKHIIKALPIIDSANENYIEEIAGNQLRVLKMYAPAFDLIANVIHQARATGTPEKHIKDTSQHYYEILIGEGVLRKYFANCGNHNIRQNLMHEVIKDLQTGWVLLRGEDPKHGRYIEKRAPFRIMAEQCYEDGMKYIELAFSKAVFGSLVTGECFANGGDGYIELPENFYPLLTSTDKGTLQSYNPIYKLNVYSIMKNTYKKSSIQIESKELLQTIVPEYIKENGCLKISPAEVHCNLIKSTQEALEKIKEGMIVSNFYINRDKSTIYFRR